MHGGPIPTQPLTGVHVDKLSIYLFNVIYLLYWYLQQNPCLNIKKDAVHNIHRFSWGSPGNCLACPCSKTALNVRFKHLRIFAMNIASTYIVWRSVCLLLNVVFYIFLQISEYRTRMFYLDKVCKHYSVLYTYRACEDSNLDLLDPRYVQCS